jgi:hypothetical protein
VYGLGLGRTLALRVGSTDVLPDCALADTQAGRNHLVGNPTRDLGEDFKLSRS